jgi:hypothetical protein
VVLILVWVAGLGERDSPGWGQREGVTNRRLAPDWEARMDVLLAGVGRRGFDLRVSLLAAAGLVACLVLGVVAVVGGSVSPSVSVRAHLHRVTSGPRGWQNMPVAARGPVSAALAAGQPAYWVHRGAGGLVAVDRAQGLRAVFGHGGVRISSGPLPGRALTVPG